MRWEGEKLSHVEFEVAAVSSVSDLLKKDVLPARTNYLPHSGLPCLRFCPHSGWLLHTFAFPNHIHPFNHRPLQTTAPCRLSHPLNCRASLSVSLTFPLVSHTEATYAINLRTGGQAGSRSLPVLCPRTS